MRSHRSFGRFVWALLLIHPLHHFDGRLFGVTRRRIKWAPLAALFASLRWVADLAPLSGSADPLCNEACVRELPCDVLRVDTHHVVFPPSRRLPGGPGLWGRGPCRRHFTHAGITCQHCAFLHELQASTGWWHMGPPSMSFPHSPHVIPSAAEESNASIALTNSLQRPTACVINSSCLLCQWPCPKP